MQYIIESLFNILVRATFLVVTSSQDHTLSEAELNAPRYAAGYVPRSLTIKLSRGSHPCKQEFIYCLKGMTEVEDSLQESLLHTKHWTNAVDRGELFKVKDDVYSFLASRYVNCRRACLYWLLIPCVICAQRSVAW